MKSAMLNVAIVCHVSYIKSSQPFATSVTTAKAQAMEVLKHNEDAKSHTRLE